MRSLKMKSVMLSLSLLTLAAVCGAATVTVGPSGQYASPCAAFPHLADGDMVQIDAKNGVPYTSEGDCTINANNVTITGVNGRPILDATGVYISKGIWIENGHDVVIDNFEFRHAQNGSNNAAGIRIQNGGATPGGGNLTIERCYIHDNFNGILTGSADPWNFWFSANPFLLFQYDEFADNGGGDDGHTHNMYIGYGGNMTFTLQYSWSHDSYIGHTVKSRAPINNILYNMIGDSAGNTSYLLNFPAGGSTYIVGNTLYKTYTTGVDSNQAMILWRDSYDNGQYDPEYDATHQDLHFINNTVVDDARNNYSAAFVNSTCTSASSDSCATPTYGAQLTVPGVFENNILVGSHTAVSNQPTAYLRNNILLSNTPGNLSSLFVNPAQFNYHLVSGSPASGAGVYPPTNNTGATDSTALARYEYILPGSIAARPTLGGSAMDDGAYSYPRVDTPASPTLSYTQMVTAPGTGTITLSGLPIPPAGMYNNAAFASGNIAAVPTPFSVSSSTGTITASFSVNPAVITSTVVPINIYVGGTHLLANVTVNPGPPVLDSVTLDYLYGPFTTVHLQGPAPVGGAVIQLTSSDPSTLYVPASVTVPAGQISAETNSNTGSLWGPDPFDRHAILTATQGGVIKTLDVDVIDPGTHGDGWNQATVVGGSSASFHVIMRGYFPNSGGTFLFTSDNPAVIPNQTITKGAGTFDEDVNIATNSVSTNTVVNLTLNINGDLCTDNTGCPNLLPITVTPGTSSAASIATVSGSGQSAVVGTSFTNPLVAVVKDSSGGAVAGVTVTFAGTGVSFPSGSTTVTNSSGLASVTAQPTSSGSLTVTASVAGVGTSASFSETGTSSVTVSSIILDDGNTYRGATTVTLSAAAPAGGAVVTITSSDQNVLYAPSTVTVPAGQTSAEIGTMEGSLWGPTPATKTATLTATYGGVSKTLTQAYDTPGLHGGGCYTCTVTSGQPVYINTSLRGFSPHGGATIQYTSSNTAVIPNQSFPIAEGQNYLESPLTTNSVATSTTVTITSNFNGEGWITNQVTVNPSANAPASIATVSGSGQSAVVGTSFTNPLVAVVKNSSGGTISGVTVTFVGGGISFPSGSTAVTNSSGLASVTAQPTSSGSLTVTASVAGVGTSASFAETGVASVTVSSVTLDNGDSYRAATTVTLSAAAPTGGAVVTITSSDQSVLYAPSTVTVPAGQTSAEIGTMEGSLWGESPATKTATLTATYGGVSKSLTTAYSTPGVHRSGCYTCTVKGGQIIFFETALTGYAPHGGGMIQYFSSNPAVIPNQSFAIAEGQYVLGSNLTTNAVSTSTPVIVTGSFNGNTWASAQVTVTP